MASYRLALLATGCQSDRLPTLGVMAGKALAASDKLRRTVACSPFCTCKPAASVLRLRVGAVWSSRNAKLWVLRLPARSLACIWRV